MSYLSPVYLSISQEDSNNITAIYIRRDLKTIKNENEAIHLVLISHFSNNKWRGKTYDLLQPENMSGFL